MKATPNLTRLLNKVEALLDSRAGTMLELVRFCETRQPHVFTWVKSRTFKPNGEYSLRLQNWVAMKEAEFRAAQDEHARRDAFEKEFRRLEKEHPVE